MSTKWQKIDLSLPNSYSKEEREAIALRIIERIVERTAKGKDKDGNSFPAYSKSYKDSLDFKIAGKSSLVNLQLTGDMLSSIEILQNKKGKLQIGYEKGSEENAKADGNIRGTYGKDRANSKKARPFLGVTDSEFKAILRQFPIKDKEKRAQSTEQTLAEYQAASDIVDKIEAELEE